MITVYSWIPISILFIWLYKLHKKRGPLPPGPPGKFLIGNLFDIPRSQSPWLVFKEWGKQYGDLVYIEALGSKMLILNSMEVVTDLLDKRGANYSHRPELVMGCELVGLSKTISMMPYGSTWRGLRKLTYSAFGPHQVKTYHRGQEEIAALLLAGLLDKPKEYDSLFSLASGRVAMSVTYGIPVQSAKDKYITEAESAFVLISQLLRPGGYLVDTLTFLKYLPEWFPFASFKKEAREGKRHIEGVVSRPFEHVQREMASGRAPSSFLRDSLIAKESGATDVETELIAWAAGAMYAAGVETTWVVLSGFILAMARFPEKQALAQAEIDRVLGATRFPTFEDRSSLPYVNALIKEVMRFFVPLPLSLPRRSAEDDYYREYLIPAGTLIMPNTWVISRGEQNGENVDDFSPERFLDPAVNAIDPLSYIFGFGRRHCPGKYLANDTSFIVIASMLAAFTVSKELDGNGKEIYPDPTFSSGIIRRAENFPCRISPRSEAVVQLIRHKMPENTENTYDL